MSTGFANPPTRIDAQHMPPRHALAALIDHIREVNGWSDSDIVAQSSAQGHKLSKSNLSRIRNTDVVSITATTIRALAAGLRIPETEVARSALASMGVDLPDLRGLDLETAIRLDASISAEDRSLLLDILRSIRMRQRRPRDRGALRPVDDQPQFDRSQLLASMAEPEGDREPEGEFPVDPPNDDFEGR